MIGAVLWAAAVLCSVTPTPAEFEERDAWVDARFRGSPGEPLAEPGLAILANYDPVQRNVHMGKPLKLQDKPFARGLFCHAPSMILVRIPSGGREFSAMVGVDTNDPAGEGSVVFSVHAGGNIVFRSDILRKGWQRFPFSWICREPRSSRSRYPMLETATPATSPVGRRPRLRWPMARSSDSMR